MNRLPIIYVRGYAGSQSDVEETVDDPFYGFNSGSTHVRIGPQGSPQFFGFESPLVRLITDWDYIDAYNRGQQQVPPGLDPEELLRTIWIYRYYDPTSKTFTNAPGKRLSIEEAAANLRDLIALVKNTTHAPKVYLVAHSMGGLVCRCLLQKIYPEKKEKGVDHVDKLFTYGTPHGGIHFDVGSGIVEWIRDQLGWNNADDFGPARMYQYLTAGVKAGTEAPSSFDPQDLQGLFPAERVFCIVGTNAHDYEVAFGMSRRTVGPQSDGLVQIEHAYVRNSNRAYVHRSHSGRYGMVNSEEGFQNLQRFLFGEVRASVSLCSVALQKKAAVTYQAETGVSIRGLPVLMQEQTAKNLCPIVLESGPQDRVPLYTSFLLPKKSATNDNTSRFSIYLAINRIESEDGGFSFTNHMEEVPVWSDYLIVDVRPDDDGTGFAAKYSWLSDHREPQTDMAIEETKETTTAGVFTSRIPLPAKGLSVVGPDAHVEMNTSFWD